MITRRLKGFVKLRRGILEHLPGLSPQVVKLFVVLLLLAEPMGTSRGVVRASVTDLAAAANMRRQTLLQAADRLVEMGWIEISKARNQHGVTAWRIVKYDIFAGAESGTGKRPAGAKRVTSKSSLPVTEAEPAGHESGTSNSPNELNPCELQAPKNLKKNTTYSRKKRDSKKSLAEEIQPWTICEAIAEAGGLEFVKASGRHLREAKALKDNQPDLSAETVKAVVVDLLEIDGGRFWNVKAPITPAAVERHLPLWRKRQGRPKVPPISQSAPPLDLASAWAQEAR